MSSLHLGWWMKRGLTSASSAAKRSTGRLCWAVVGSMPPNVSATSSRAKDTSSRDAGEAA